MVFCLRLTLGTIILILVCTGCKIKEYTKREKDISFTDVEVLVSYWDSTRRRASTVDYISAIRHLDRSLDAYMISLLST